jgi:hypothetical protein
MVQSGGQFSEGYILVDIWYSDARLSLKDFPKQFKMLIEVFE